MFSACSSDSVNEESEQVTNSNLRVHTRGATDSDGETKISYPVRIFAFDTDNSCVGTSTIESENNNFSMKLQPGTYNIYAIAGASDTDYTIPDAETATPLSVVTLNADKEHSDLMVASSTAFELSEGNNTLEMQLTRKVMMLQSVTINNLPQTATAVKVTISPLNKNIQIDGDYSGTISKDITLTQNTESNRWENTTEMYLLPASGNTTITITVSDGTEDKVYSYTCTNNLEANHKITLVGNYKAEDITMTGTIIGDEWDDSQDETFEFSKSSE